VLAEEHLERWGADALRLHLLSLTRPTADVEWDETGLRGCARFLERAHAAVLARRGRGRFVSRRVLVLKHRLIRRVTRAIRTFHLNKAVSAFMVFVKELRAPDLTLEEVDRETLRTFVILLQPFAPHAAAEMWEQLGESSSLEEEPWPEYSEELLRPVEVEIAIFVDDRLVDRVVIDPNLGKTELLHLVEKREKVLARTGGRRADRVIVVPERLVHLIYDVSRGATPPDPAPATATAAPPRAEPAGDPPAARLGAEPPRIP
jgi:leucyl-tRNA synthetase